MSSGVGSFLIALVTIGSAATVSVTSTEIFKEYGETADWNTLFATPHLWPAVLFSLVAVAFITLREMGVVDSAKKKERELQQQINTMPPKNFLTAYRDAVIDIRMLYEFQVLGDTSNVTLESIAADIRLVMSKMLMLAQQWEGAPSDVYRANVMLAEDDKAWCKEHLSNELNQSPFFLFGSNLDARLDGTDGILHISSNELSTVFAGQLDGEPDADIEPICFPFVLPNTKLKAHHPNIPGAPEAVSSLRPQYIANCRTHYDEWLDTELRDDSHISPHYQGVISKYYGRHKFAVSILAIPLYVKNIDGSKQRLGCLNIYKDKKNILMGDSRNNQFVELLLPLCSFLSDMISLYRVYKDVEAA
ncbi:hypothetical protein SAMN05216496_2018 [Pseudomonas sp. Z003-0.4C(8344-21)]|nr:hypothetical protein SAMN05216496_2018 [Pseudomonas sp. Z003-0.4C(8344-21)]